jgi:BarA-like signal transduction histidine kinase
MVIDWDSERLQHQYDAMLVNIQYSATCAMARDEAEFLHALKSARNWIDAILTGEE